MHCNIYKWKLQTKNWKVPCNINYCCEYFGCLLLSSHCTSFCGAFLTLVCYINKLLWSPSNNITDQFNDFMIYDICSTLVTSICDLFYLLKFTWLSMESTNNHVACKEPFSFHQLQANTVNIVAKVSIKLYVTHIIISTLKVTCNVLKFANKNHLHGICSLQP